MISELALILSLSLFAAMCWYPCHCAGGGGVTTHCFACDGTDGPASENVTIVLSGVAGNVCGTSGALYNGTYIVPWYSGCTWVSDLAALCPTDPGDGWALHFWVTKISGGNYTAQVDIRIRDASRGFTAVYAFYLDSGQSTTKYDCLTFNLEIPFTTSTYDLDWLDCSAATATVTSS